MSVGSAEVRLRCVGVERCVDRVTRYGVDSIEGCLKGGREADVFKIKTKAQYPYIF